MTYYFPCLLTWQISLTAQQNKDGFGFLGWRLTGSGYTSPVNSEEEIRAEKPDGQHKLILV